MMNARKWRHAIKDLRDRLLSAELRLRGAELAFDPVPERPQDIESGLYCARALLTLCERENFIADSIRELVESILSRIERQIVSLSPNRRPQLRVLGVKR